jgi:AraC family transcriptional regulator
MSTPMATSEYLVLSHGTIWDERLSPADIENATKQFYDWYKRLIKEGKMRSGHRLAAEGKILSGRKAIVDGPFAESKEAVAGYWFIQAATLEEAVEIAKGNPCLDYGVTVEVRPIIQDQAIGLEPPRFVNGKRLLLAGLRERVENLAGIPALWQRALTYKTPKRLGPVDYGVCFHCNTDQFEYLAGFEVPDFSDLPAGLSWVTIPPQKYAVFSHRGHVSELWQTCEKIGKWLEQSDVEHAVAGADAPDFFERYGEEFDPQTGAGGMEVWVSIKNSPR